MGISFHNEGDKWECVDEKYVMLDQVLLIPGMKQFFEKSGYATCFAEGKYILAENVLKRIYQGALGEVVGRCILTKKIFNFTGHKLEQLPQDLYEKFDNRSEDIYFDFKLWSGAHDPTHQSQIKRIRSKMYACRARKVVFVSILKPKGMDKPYLEGLNDPIFVLPYLFDTEKGEWNRVGIHRLYEVITNTL